MKVSNFWNSVRAMPSNAVIVATHSPGFSANLSKWYLVIDDEGNLYQDTEVWEWTAEKGIVTEHREEKSHIGAGEVTRLIKKAEVVLRQPIPEPDCMMTDAATNILKVRIGEHLQQVASEAEGFWDLWQDVHRNAPYPPK